VEIAVKKKPVAAGLSRVELARRLCISLTGTDRLIAQGLRPVGQRGPAKLYNVRAARELARQLGRPATSTAAVVEALNARTDDLQAKLAALADEWIAPEAWAGVWADGARQVAAFTAGWPAQMAAAALEVRQRAREARSRGLAAQEHMRPLLEALAEALAGWEATLEGALAPPAPLPACAPPPTTAEARTRLLEARAALSRLRVAIRRGGWRRRQDVRRALADRVVTARSVFWVTWPGVAARHDTADAAATRADAEAIRAEALAALRGAAAGPWSPSRLADPSRTNGHRLPAAALSWERP
jgi:hypothetical protein